MLESERRERLSYGDDPKRNYPHYCLIISVPLIIGATFSILTPKTTETRCKSKRRVTQFLR